MRLYHLILGVFVFVFAIALPVIDINPIRINSPPKPIQGKVLPGQVILVNPVDLKELKPEEKGMFRNECTSRDGPRIFCRAIVIKQNLAILGRKYTVALLLHRNFTKPLVPETVVPDFIKRLKERPSAFYPIPGVSFEEEKYRDPDRKGAYIYAKTFIISAKHAYQYDITMHDEETQMSQTELTQLSRSLESYVKSDGPTLGKWPKSDDDQKYPKYKYNIPHSGTIPNTISQAGPIRGRIPPGTVIQADPDKFQNSRREEIVKFWSECKNNYMCKMIVLGEAKKQKLSKSFNYSVAVLVEDEKRPLADEILRIKAPSLFEFIKAKEGKKIFIHAIPFQINDKYAYPYSNGPFAVNKNELKAIISEITRARENWLLNSP